MAQYIYPAPGTGAQATLKLEVVSDATNDELTVPSLQDITISAANDIFTWTQLDETAKKSIATTATNSISCNIVLNQFTFFGDSGSAAGTASNAGIMGMSTEKYQIDFTLFMGKESSGADGKTLTGTGYITGLAPTASA